MGVGVEVPVVSRILLQPQLLPPSLTLPHMGGGNALSLPHGRDRISVFFVRAAGTSGAEQA